MRISREEGTRGVHSYQNTAGRAIVNGESTTRTGIQIMRKESITISHRITANSIVTTVRMPGKTPITKTWHRHPSDGSFIMDNCNTWEDEDLPDEVAREADRTPSGICSLMVVDT